MKQILFSLTLLMFLMPFSFAQNAVDFTCNDCDGTSHNLFSELDSAKVVVLCWVMPCGSCVGPSLTTYQVVKSFDTIYPGKVRMYLVDDYANTNCTSLKSWATGNGIKGITLFSDANIRMSDYGSIGMPKIVVVAGPEHKVFYNASNSVNATALQDSILKAIQTATAGVHENPGTIKSLSVFPNPTASQAFVKVYLEAPEMVYITVMDAAGKPVLTERFANLSTGENLLKLEIGELSPGMYLLVIRDKSGQATTRLTVSR